MADSQTPAPLSDAALDDLDRLAKAATPGPWVYNSYSNVFATTVFNPPETPEDIDDPEHKTVAGRGPDGPRERNVDLAYIAAAHPTTILALISALRALRTAAASAYRRGGEDMQRRAKLVADKHGEDIIAERITALVPGEPHD